MSKKTSTKQTTLVTFLLDRSSSMGICQDATIEAFNGYISELKQAKTPILFTFLQFDYHIGCNINKVHFEKPIKDISELDRNTYQPRGGTPLIEAATKTIRALNIAIKSKTNKPKIVVCIQTDGEENQSNYEYTWTSLKNLIEAKTKDGWQFNFMGAGIDAYDQGRKMGISVGSTMSYDHTNLGTTRAAFTASATNTAMFASGQARNTDYSSLQKQASGDKFAPTAFDPTAKVWPGPMQQVHVPLSTGEALDLTTSGSHPVPTSANPLDLTHLKQ